MEMKIAILTLVIALDGIAVIMALNNIASAIRTK